MLLSLAAAGAVLELRGGFSEREEKGGVARRSEKDVYGDGDQCMVQAFQALCGTPMGWVWMLGGGVWKQVEEETNRVKPRSRTYFLNCDFNGTLAF